MRVIKEIEHIREFVANGLDIRYCSFQNIDFRGLNINWRGAMIESTYFLGCQFRGDAIQDIINKGGYVFRAKPDLPYNAFRESLYSADELMQGYSASQDNSYDKKIYDHFVGMRYNPDIAEALWQRIHDHAIDDALRELIGMNDEGMTKKKVVAFMGGHATSRQDPIFEKVVFLAKALASKGYFVASGGGPGIMEAANFGAYMSAYSNYETYQALDDLKSASVYTDTNYLLAAQRVKAKFPDGNASLAIPTWFYGHEPSNLFSSHIAKYFSNSIREDILLSIALYGVIYAPGSAGTFQEIFMDVAQNHYATFRYISPMIFLNRKFYEEDTFIYPVLKKISSNKTYNKLLFISDDIDEIVSFVLANQPIDSLS